MKTIAIKALLTFVGLLVATGSMVLIAISIGNPAGMVTGVILLAVGGVMVWYGARMGNRPGNGGTEQDHKEVTNDDS